MTQPERVMRPCIQGGMCPGCTDACVELNPCPECGAGRNERCKDVKPIVIEIEHVNEPVIELY